MPYEERPQVFQCTNCGMYSHHMSSCRQPRCMVCSSKSHDTEDHPAAEGPRCVNCKWDHPSDHKACNTRHIQLGLKPIPTTQDKPQQGKISQKGEGCKTRTDQPPNPETQLNIGLTDIE